MTDRKRMEREAWVGLRSLMHEHYDRRSEVAETVGMSFIRSKALRHLARQPMTMRELGALLMIDAPYTTVVVDGLEERELVTRSPHPDDRRVKLVTITAAGRASARRANRVLAEPPVVVAELDDDDLAALHRVVALLVERSATAPDSAVARKAGVAADA